jgi:SH3-like domain-containing protein
VDELRSGPGVAWEEWQAKLTIRLDNVVVASVQRCSEDGCAVEVYGRGRSEWRQQDEL